MDASWAEVSDPALMQMKPLVSVHMITYNQAAFLAQAIEGVVMQNTPFPIELVIGVDCSPDNTLEVALQYQRRYPHLVRVRAAQERVGALINFCDTFAACRGKYIAMCEGDDFWIDPSKLVKQVTTLQADPSLAGCFHDCYRLNDANGRSTLRIGSRKIDYCADTASLLREKNITTCSMLFLNCVRASDLMQHAAKVTQGDYILCLLVSERGRWKYLSDPMAVYRIHDGGIWSGISSAVRCREDVRFFSTVLASGRYPEHRKLLSSVRRDRRRGLAVALAREGNFLESFKTYLHSLGPKTALKGRHIPSSKYFKAIARTFLSRLGLLPLVNAIRCKPTLYPANRP